MPAETPNPLPVPVSAGDTPPQPEGPALDVKRPKRFMGSKRLTSRKKKQRR